MWKLFLILFLTAGISSALELEQSTDKVTKEALLKELELRDKPASAADKSLAAPQIMIEQSAQDRFDLEDSQVQQFGPLMALALKEPQLFSDLSIDDLRHFGHDIFRKLSVQLSRVPEQLRQVPSEYELGNGDQLRIHAWNESQDQTLIVQVNQNGMIQFPLAGEVALSGIKKNNLNDYLKDRLSKYFKNLQVSSELVDLRKFAVYVTGEVKLPGAHVATALSTPIRLLMASGGVNSKGSLRQIQILRNGKLVETLDLYDFLMKGSVNKGFHFEPEDVLHVPMAGRKVAVVGKVRRPAIYELAGQEGFKETIKLAGGFEADAVQGAVQRLSFNRMGNPLLEDLDYKYSASTKLSDGELLIIRGSGAILENKVQVMGHVFQPGYFQWSRELSVKKLIEKAQGLRNGAFKLRAELLRKLKDPAAFAINASMSTYTSTSVVSINLSQELSQSTTTLLQKGDILTVFSLEEMQISPKVEVIGAVEQPGTFTLRADEKVRDVLFMAKLAHSAETVRGEIHRPTTSGVSVIEFDVGQAMLEDETSNITLGNGDVVSIFENPDLKNMGRLTLRGEVKFPGVYPFQKGERLVSILKRAGGLTEQAYLPAARFYRKSIRERQRQTRDKYVEREQNELDRVRIETVQKAQDDGVKEDLQGLDTVSQALKNLENLDLEGRITLDLYGISSLLEFEKHSSNLRLEDGDLFHVAEKPSEISVIGQVYSPLTVLFQENLNFMDYINQAGGLTDQAMKHKIYVIKADGSAVPVNSRRRDAGLLGYVNSVKVSDRIFAFGGLQVGDSIVVPTRVGIRQDRFQESLDRIYKLAISVGALGGLFK